MNSTEQLRGESGMAEHRRAAASTRACDGHGTRGIASLPIPQTGLQTRLVQLAQLVVRAAAVADDLHACGQQQMGARCQPVAWQRGPLTWQGPRWQGQQRRQQQQLQPAASGAPASARSMWGACGVNSSSHVSAASTVSRKASTATGGGQVQPGPSRLAAPTPAYMPLPVAGVSPPC